MSRIVKLEAENVKRLHAVSIAPSGAVVTIRGDNGQGKSSVLDSIVYALAGEKSHPAEPIRRGTDKARVLIETDDGIVVERRFTAGGTRLEVRTREGAKFASPQKLLEGLVGPLSFDPLAFMRERPDRQAEVLRQLLGVDFSILDDRRRKSFDSRTAVNREAAAIKARLDAMPVVEAPDQVVSAADLLAEQEIRRSLADSNDAKRRALLDTREAFKHYEKIIAEDKAKIARLEEELSRTRALLANDEKVLEEFRAQGSALRAEVDALKDPDMEEIPARLREIETTNERVRQKKTRAELAEQLQDREAESERLTAEIESIDRQKESTLDGAAFPVPGLGFSERGITLGGLPLEQGSSAEQLRVSVAMGLALNPKLKVLLIRDGSLLDETSLRLVAEMAEKAEAQVWLEIVGKGGVGVVIEDGQVESGGEAANVEHHNQEN